MRFAKTAVLLIVCAASAAAQSAAPVEAMLRRGVGDPVFHLNQPAYVAVFELLPGQEVQQLYPRSSAEAARLTDAGEHPLSHYAEQSSLRVYGRPVSTTDVNGRMQTTFFAAGPGVSGSALPTRTLVLVASRTPLRQVGARDASRQWLRQVTGFRASWNSNFAPEPIVTKLINAVLPAGAPSDDQVSDVLELDAPSVASTNRLAGQSISFNCPSGAVSVPAQAFADVGVFRCPGFPANLRPITPGSASQGASGNGDQGASRGAVLARQKQAESSTMTTTSSRTTPPNPNP